MNKVVLNENTIKNTNELIKRYLKFIDVKKNTVQAYNTGLLQFKIYLEERNIAEPTRENIIEFREYLMQNHKPNTVNSYLVAIRNFYNWLEFEGISKDISKKVKSVNVGNEHKRNALTQEQSKLILSNAKDIREKALFLLGITCGLRANEIINVRLQDFKIKDGRICLYVLGKARDYKRDFVLISKEVYEILQNYIKKYEINDYLFVSTSNHNSKGKLTTKTVRLIIKNMFKRVGIDGEEYSCHSLRHSFATMAIKSGIDIREVSQAMRHRNISTTTIYLHDLEKINNKCSTNVSDAILKEVI